MHFRRRARISSKRVLTISANVSCRSLRLLRWNVNFGLEVHPTEIAFDIASAHRALNAVKHHRRFGFNYDPSHLGYQGVDYVRFIREFKDRIFHCSHERRLVGPRYGDVGVFGGHTNFGDHRRYWDFRSIGHGDIHFEDIIVALNESRTRGPLSIEWEDVRMDRAMARRNPVETCARTISHPAELPLMRLSNGKRPNQKRPKQDKKLYDKKIKMGMVGGGRDAFIGAVHRMAARLDGRSSSSRAPFLLIRQNPGFQAAT